MNPLLWHLVLVMWDLYCLFGFYVTKAVDFGFLNNSKAVKQNLAVLSSAFILDLCVISSLREITAAIKSTTKSMLILYYSEAG